MTDSDEQQNLPSVPEQQTVQVVQMPVAEFEGEMVRIMHGKLPGETLLMEYGYRRGTHLKIELEVEVIRVSVDEKRSGRDKGDLIREHTFALREAKILGAYTAEQMDEQNGSGVGGSLAGDQQADDEPTEADTTTEEKKTYDDDIPDF